MRARIAALYHAVMLPRTLTRFAWFPLLPGFVALAAAALLLAVPIPDAVTSRLHFDEGGTSGYSDQEGSIRTSGRANIDVNVTGDWVLCTGGGLGGWKVARIAPGSFELTSESGVRMMRGEWEDDTFRILDISGAPAYRLVRDDEEYKLKDSSGTLLTRFKIKEGKFNIYDGNGVRVLHGKEKRGAFIVREENDSEVGSLVFGSGPSLDEKLLSAAVLYLPQSDDLKLLLLGALRLGSR